MGHHTQVSPHDRAGILSRIFFAWLFPIVRQTPPDVDEAKLTALPKAVDIEQGFNRLKSAWKRQLESKSPSFMSALMSCFKWELLNITFLFSMIFMLPLVSSMLIGLIINYLEDDLSVWVGLGLAWGVLILSILIATSTSHALFWGGVLGSVIKLSGVQLLYDKTFKLAYSALNENSAAGKIVTLAAKDFESFDKVYLATFAVFAPFYLPAAGFALWWYLGVSGLVGLGVSLLNLPMQIIFSVMFNRIWTRFSNATDERVSLVTDIIEGIKILKLYAWEKPFLGMNESVRETEISHIRKASYYRVSSYTMFLCGQALLLLVTYWVYVSLGNELVYNSVFVGMAILTQVHLYNSSCFAMAMEFTGIYRAACTRITQALLLPEKEQQTLQHSNPSTVEIVNMSASWESKKPDSASESDKLTTKSEQSIALNNVNLKVEPGELCVVIGEVGSGKSSLLMSLLGELHILEGKINIGNSVAFVEQEPWILTASIKDNILMNKCEDETKYWKTTEACCLSEDFKEMAHQDMTMIGDKGVNISGGQKARIALARAVYTDRDIYLMDDPLSAVDAAVSSKLFTRCIKGVLKSKTRILVTHQQFVLPEADKIVLMHQGQILFQGNYQEFLSYSKTYSTLLRSLDYDTENTEKPNELVIASKPKDHLGIISEEKDTGSVPLRLYLDFFLESFKHSFFIVLYIVFCVAMQGLYVFIQWWIAYWTDQNKSEQGELFYVQVLGMMLGALFVGTFIRNFIFIQTLLSSCKSVYLKALYGVASTCSTFFDANPTGRIINRFSRDTYIMDDVMTVFMMDLVQMALIFFGYVIAMAIFVPMNIVSIVLFVVLVMKLRSQSVPAARELKRIELITRSPIFNWLNAGVTGIIQVRCFGWRKFFFDNLQETAQHNMRAYYHFASQLRYFLYFTDLAVAFVVGINTFFVVFWFGKQDPAAGALSIAFALSVGTIISYIGRDWLETEIGMTSVQRLYDYSNLPAEESGVTKELIVTEGKVAFYNVVMKYREHLEPALKGLTFEIQPRQKIGIVGRTGAGKSSIFQCIFRLVPLNSGCIMIDNQDISQVTLESLRMQIGIIPQLPFMFRTSVRKNLDPYDEYLDEEIWEALEKVELKKIFQKDPMGIYSNISSGSASLSMGQRQLLCLARMLLRRNKVLFLDEATANVDNKTDELIQAKVNEFFYASTVVCIAHRINTVIDADSIVVMQAGKVGESGHPAELLENPNSMFTSLVNELGAEEAQRMKEVANSSKKPN